MGTRFVNAMSTPNDEPLAFLSAAAARTAEIAVGGHRYDFRRADDCAIVSRVCSVIVSPASIAHEQRLEAGDNRRHGDPSRAGTG
jgi:hypothetical protein